jgi:hypothetical protein
MWPELSRSTEIERQQFDILSKGCAQLSVNARTTRHVQMLDSISIGEGSHVPRRVSVFRPIELDGSSGSEYQNAILTVLGELICRNQLEAMVSSVNCARSAGLQNF